MSKFPIEYDKALYPKLLSSKFYKKGPVILMMDMFSLRIFPNGTGDIEGVVPELKPLEGTCNVSINGVSFQIKIITQKLDKWGPSVQNLKDLNH